jgi:hypothetical protein
MRATWYGSGTSRLLIGQQWWPEAGRRLIDELKELGTAAGLIAGAAEALARSSVI